MVTCLGTIEAFELPPSIKKHFERVLDAVSEGRGRAFWIQSEYGGGKTHFIAALTALLGQSTQGDDFDSQVWAAVNDTETKSRAATFVKRRILPVAVSCKGIMPLDGQYSRALLRLLTDGLATSLASFSLEDKVPITADQELVTHFLSRPSALREQIDVWCKQHFGATVTELNEAEGPEKAAQAYRKWWSQEAGAEPSVDQNVVDWLTGLCHRLEAQGFDGLLVVIDEFATLQNLVKPGPDRAAYEDVLESLGWLVPQRLLQQGNQFSVFTIVASQQGRPTKLDERYSDIPLLAQDAAHDYEIIVSRRVRTLKPGRLPEVDQYYHHHKLTHDTYARMDIERFRDVFPFQPRVFDAIWHITAAGGDVAAARFGIAAVWDILKKPGILDQARLLTVSDLLQSEQFQNDLQATDDYRDAFRAFQAARAAARSLTFNSADLDLALQILDALFVDYLAYYRSPRWLSTQELAESALATSSSVFIPPADQVLRILGQLRQLPQIEFRAGEGARFRVADTDGRIPAAELGKKKDAIADDDPRLATDWADLLQATAPGIGFWSDFKMDTPKTVKSLHSRIQYQGWAELRHTVGKPAKFGDLSHGSGKHFHIVVSATPADLAPDDLADPRVAVVVPDALSADEIELCKTHIACREMLDDTELMSSASGPALRAHAEGERRDAAQKIIARQAHAYRRGRIVSRTGIVFNPDATFNTISWKKAVDSIVDPLLGAAYDKLDSAVHCHLFKGSSVLDPTTDTGKMFARLVGGSDQTADVGAAQNFGPGLGLSKPMFHTLELDHSHFGISLLLERIGAAGKSGVTAEALYEQLCSVPYGVPNEIVTLWMLSCVRAGTVGPERQRIEIELQKNNKARLKGAARIQGNAITFVNVKDIEWAGNLRSDFLSVRISEEVPFGEIVEYAKVFDPMLKVPATPEAIAQEEERLQKTVEDARKQGIEVQTALSGLSSAMNQPVPKDTSQSIQRLVESLTLVSGYERGQLLAQVRQAYPSTKELQTAWARIGGWSRLVQHAAELGSLHTFVHNLQTRLSSSPGRYQQAVNKVSLEIAPRLNLAGLLADPSSVEATLHAARAVRDAYTNEYRIHHRDYFQAIAALREQLASIQKKAATLGQLNMLRCAGPPALADAGQRADKLENRLRLCPHSERTDIEVTGNLTCQREGCELPGLDPLAEPPSSEVEAFGTLLDDAIRHRVNTIKAEAIRAILEQQGETSIGTFLAIIQAGQFDGLLEVLDDELVARIDQILDRARVRVVPTGVVARLAQRYPTIQKSQINEVTQALRKDLERAFAEQEQANPNAVIQLQLALQEPK